MRIVSQNCNVDMPYEEVVILHVCNSVMALYDGKEYTLGVYSSMEKSYKAMEMLRATYCRIKTFNSICGGSYEALGSGLNSGNKEIELLFNNFLSMNTFKFPKDEEIEVENET